MLCTHAVKKVREALQSRATEFNDTSADGNATSWWGTKTRNSYDSEVQYFGLYLSQAQD